MSQSATTTKIELRGIARAKRAGFAAAKPRFAEAIAAFAASLPLLPAIPVASYWPLRDEADPRQLARALSVLGHPILLPRMAGADAPLSFRLWGEGDGIELGAYGMSEPLSVAPERRPGAVLVPLLAFDCDGYRLGYGGGYYDRTLSALRAGGQVLAIGIAYAEQELDQRLRHDPHDERLDMVVTENGVREFSGRTAI